MSSDLVELEYPQRTHEDWVEQMKAAEYVIRNLQSELNATVERLEAQKRVNNGFERSHAHEKRELYMSLRDKYICAIAGNMYHALYTECYGDEWARKVIAYADLLLATARPEPNNNEERTTPPEEDRPTGNASNAVTSKT